MFLFCPVDEQEQSVADMRDSTNAAESNAAVEGESGKGDTNLAMKSDDEMNDERTVEKKVISDTSEVDDQRREEAEASERSNIVETSNDLEPAKEDKREGTKEANKVQTSKTSGLTKDQPITGDEKATAKSMSFQAEDPAAVKTGEKEEEKEMKSDGATAESRHADLPPPQPVHCQF